MVVAVVSNYPEAWLSYFAGNFGIYYPVLALRPFQLNILNCAFKF
jgi:hypothetical protein